MSSWLTPAIDYVSQWLDHQMRHSEMPGCVIAVVHMSGLGKENTLEGMLDHFTASKTVLINTGTRAVWH